MFRIKIIKQKPLKVKNKKMLSNWELRLKWLLNVKAYNVVTKIGDKTKYL